MRPRPVSYTHLTSTTAQHSMEHAMSAYHHELPHGAGLITVSYTHLDVYKRQASHLGDASQRQSAHVLSHQLGDPPHRQHRKGAGGQDVGRKQDKDQPVHAHRLKKVGGGSGGHQRPGQLPGLTDGQDVYKRQTQMSTRS